MGGGLWYGKARARMQEFAATPSSPGSSEKGKGAEMEPLVRGEGGSGSDAGGGAARDAEAGVQQPGAGRGATEVRGRH